ncbi:MAG: GlpM family protein [Minisyncoccia bacterium]
MGNIIIYFITGGLFTTLIVILEQSGFRLLSGLMALIPVFTLVSYIFIGQSGGALAVTQHAKFVLWGTIFSWIPYMIAVVYLAPKIGPTKAIIVGMVIFFVLATIFTLVVNRYGFFQ